MQIVDTIGAGDSFTAALVMGLLGGLDLEHIHRAAADIADFVCSNPGATPVLPERLRAKFGFQNTKAKSIATESASVKTGMTA